MVEDSLENRVITRIALTSHGAVLDFDIWGLDTIRRLKGFAPVDAIILDLMLPRGMTGYKVFDLIRAQPAFAKVPIIAVSAVDPSEAIPLCIEKGFSGFIAKPLDTEAFPEQVAEVIAGKNIWTAGYR